MDAPLTPKALQPPLPEAPHHVQPAPQGGVSALETSRSVLRLLVGLALIGGTDLVARLHECEASQPTSAAERTSESGARSPVGAAMRALTGLASEVVDSTARTVSATGDAAQAVAGAVNAAIRPVASSALLRPVTAPVKGLATAGHRTFGWFAGRLQAEERRARQLARDVTGLLLEDIVGYAGENPGVKRLVDAQVERLLPSLVADPTIQDLLVQQLGEWLEGLSTRSETLDPLVRGLGDRYIAYLNDHPDDVQNLVQGQAVSMAGEVRDSVRTITVTGDSFLEALARGLLRRTPREDLPPPDLRRRYSRIPAPTGAQTTESAA